MQADWRIVTDGSFGAMEPPILGGRARLVAGVLAGFSGLALLLAVLGIYGVMSSGRLTALPVAAAHNPPACH